MYGLTTCVMCVNILLQLRNSWRQQLLVSKNDLVGSSNFNIIMFLSVVYFIMDVLNF